MICVTYFSFEALEYKFLAKKMYNFDKIVYMHFNIHTYVELVKVLLVVTLYYICKARYGVP